MRIAYLLGQFPVFSETFIGNEIRALEAAGHEVVPIALHRALPPLQPDDGALMERTMYFSEINPAASRALLKQYRFKYRRLRSFAKAQTTEPYLPLLVHAAAVANTVRAKRCTHIHAHFGWGATTYAIAAAKLLKFPVTFTCHGSDVYTRPLDLVLKCKNASAVIGVAPTITRDLQKIGSSTLCHTIYCGVDTERFKPADMAKKHGRWLFAGRLIDCKGIEEILAAWALIPEPQRPGLDIVGDGPLKDALEDYIRLHNLEAHVHLLGAKDSAWIAEHGPHYKAFIAAFRQGRDGSRDTAPMALKEAMAMGLPVVTTEFIDIPEITGKECAMLCAPSSVDALAKAVISMQNLTTESLQRMGEAGRARVEQHYSLKRQAEQLLQLWETL